MQNKAEKIIVKLVEELAFSDSPIMKEGDNSEDDGIVELKRYPHDGKTSVATLSKTTRTREMMRNWKVAPLYYTVALLFRWIKKAPGPPTAWLTTTHTVSRIIVTILWQLERHWTE